ncbi:ABC transporter ATP-binding protein [Flavobacteriaceae bacterium]|nr:ABC transporter ATP-binding protein [Flavobacteriaceae bacterium]
MSEIILKVENLSKQYRLGTISTGTISHDLNRWWHKIRGKENPYLRIGETNDRSSKGELEYVWALKDINFEVKKGEVLGIIGKNGAGKSTLLKILSQVTSPTTGSIKTRGRIASLLEVGTGFHPEMTGRENIFLNGAILGMTKKEIKSKLEEIIEFSGCERYIDTPVKRYSSGMKVRLAFAVAAFLEPDILVVDEVLAVGDAEFQKKAIGKMQDISQGDGRTVLFVSHDMGAVSKLCDKSILIENGTIKYFDVTKNVIQIYLDTSNEGIRVFSKNNFHLSDLKCLSGGNQNLVQVFDNLTFSGVIDVNHWEQIEEIKLEFFIKSKNHGLISTVSTWLDDVKINVKNKIEFELYLENINFIEGEYEVDLRVYDGEITDFLNVINFEVVKNPEINIYHFKMKPHIHGKFYIKHEWEFI